jgi:hypothetical protein
MLIFRLLHNKVLTKNITFRMKNTKKKLKDQFKVVKDPFTRNNITKHSGLNMIAKYMSKQGLIKSVNTFLPAVWHSDKKFGVNQIMILH